MCRRETAIRNRKQQRGRNIAQSQAHAVDSVISARPTGVRRTAKSITHGDELELITSLTELGLTLNEARVYLALLQSESLPASQVADRAGVPRPKVYESLRTLEERGFCTARAGGIAKFHALPPEPALRDLLEEREDQRQFQAELDAAVVSDLIERLPQPLGLEPSSHLSPYIEAVFGRSRTSRALESVISHAQSELVMMQQPPFVQPQVRWNIAELAAIKRGVNMRIIYSHAAIRPPRYTPLLEAGADIRVSPELPMKLCIADGDLAMVSLRDPQTHEQGLTSLVIRHPDLVAALGSTFELQWNDAAPFNAQYLSSSEP